ncbi:DNA-binding response regulator [Enterobacterales bacterium CwR94]|nr:DNA-binding response regulator [Enterobacterales bacterium CwR94]
MSHHSLPMTDNVKLLIAEDHPLVRLGMRNLFESCQSVNVVAEVADGLEVYSSCIHHQPDIVLLDLTLPGMHGIDVIYKIRQRWCDIKIVVITADAMEHRAGEALKAGANAYILKNSPQQLLLETVWSVMRGNTVVDPKLSVNILEVDPGERNVTLTSRERQVLKLIAEGRRNRDIAEDLTITVKTVETHRMNLMRKLDAHNAAELTHWVYRLGL